MEPVQRIENMENNNNTPQNPLSLPLVLTISGSDPSGGAGLEADLKTFHQHGVYGMAVPTLLTVQNTTGVKNVQYLSGDFLEAQIQFLFEDLAPSIIKIGAVGSRQVLQSLIRLFSQSVYKNVPIVLDPVLVSTSGLSLFDMRGLSDMLDRLLPLATLVTPNIPEFGLMSGKQVTPSTAASILSQYGRDKNYSILLKGGHFEEEPTDYLLHKGAILPLPSRRINTRHTHGTGCVLASSIAAHLALGEDLPTAVKKAQSFVHRAIATNPGLGQGQGPLNLWA
jgi:hydroxymethylpyrimidine/phosphomethylpyrimidine kinase